MCAVVVVKAGEKMKSRGVRKIGGCLARGTTAESDRENGRRVGNYH